MVQLECLEASEGCEYKTQDLPFDEAEKILDMHMNRKHPINAPPPVPQKVQLKCPQCDHKTQEVSNDDEATKLLEMHRKRHHPSDKPTTKSPAAPTVTKSSPAASLRSGGVESVPGYVKLSGMVWSVTEEDIKKFLHDCSVRRIVLIKTGDGRPSGDAVVELDKDDDTIWALRHNRENIRERFVVVEKITKEEYDRYSR